MWTWSHLISAVWSAVTDPLDFYQMYQYHAKNIHDFGTGTNSAFWPLSRIHWLYALMHYRYILVLPVFRLTTNFYVQPIKFFFLLNNTQYKSTTNSIQPALLKMCSPVIYHVRFLSLNCLIKDMIIPNTLLNLSPLLPSG